MNDRQQHPTDDELDMLRAGLLDDEPARHARVVAHAEGCAICRTRLGLWQRVAAELDQSTETDAALSAALAERRQAAIAAAQPAQPHRGWNRALVATAASVAISIGLGLGMWYRTQIQTASIPAPMVSQAGDEDAADLYSNIDFYVWLGNQDAKPSQKGNET
jgi:anti-sigma factor RsiW